MTPLLLNQPVLRSAPQPTPSEDFFIQFPQDGSYTITSDGDADFLLNLYGPFNTIPVDGMNLAGQVSHLHLQGIAKWTNGNLMNGIYIVRVQQNTPGSFNFTIRPWAFGDQMILLVRGTP